MTNCKPKTLILGVGNLLLKDEGVGIHVVRELENETLPDHVSLLDGGTGGIHLINWLQDYDRIIMIDATLDRNPPGTIRTLRPRYSKDFPVLMSAHEIGLKDMIEAMIITEKLPDVELIVVSAKDVQDMGIELTPDVQAAVPHVIERVKELVNA